MLDFSTLNEAQRQAVMHGEGPLLLLAGPGSGKTTVITNRILYLIHQGVSPGKILVITFTKEAALSMQERFKKLCNNRVYPVHFGTFHSVFYHILRESNCLTSTRVLTASEKKNLLIPILNQYEESKDLQQYLGEDALKILSAISYYKNTMRLTDTVNRVPIQWQPHFEKIYNYYEMEVSKLGQVDFDDMVFKCLKLLQKNTTIQEFWQNRFQHILVDEFQDINPIQYETLRLISSSPYHLFAVGDDDQSIYGFRGSHPECLKKYMEDYHARQLLLDLNYRSYPEIVKASLAVIGENKNRYIKYLQSAVRRESSTSCDDFHMDANMDKIGTGNYNKEKPVIIKAFQDKTEEIHYLVNSIQEVLRQGCFHSCAVLFRTNQLMQSFCVAFSKAEINYKIKEKTSNVYEHFVVQDILTYLKLAKGMGCRKDFLSVMNKPSRYLRRDMIVFEKGKLNSEKTKINYMNSSLPDREKMNVAETLQILEKQVLAINKLSLVPAISYILKVVGYERYLVECAVHQQDKLEEWLENVSWLKKDAADYNSLEEWMDFQKKYAEESHEKNVQKKQGNCKEQATICVELLTAHGAKGLEFDKVWIPDCNETIYPYGRMPDDHTVEEERRIFYVAMTRAKKSLELLYLTGTRERSRQPSAFLNPLYSSSTNSSNSQLSKYSSNASATFSYSASSAM